MSTGIEPVDIIDPWLYSTLSTDAQIIAVVGDRVFGDGAPGPARLPALTWDMNSARDIVTHNGATIEVECLFDVKAICQGSSYEPIRAVTARMNALLHGVDVDTARGRISCRRERVIRYPEIDDNIQYRHLGGTYRIRAYSL